MFCLLIHLSISEDIYWRNCTNVNSVTFDSRTKMILNDIKILFIYIVISGSVKRSWTIRLLFIFQFLLSFRCLMNCQTISAAIATRSSRIFLVIGTLKLNIWWIYTSSENAIRLKSSFEQIISVSTSNIVTPTLVENDSVY